MAVEEVGRRNTKREMRKMKIGIQNCQPENESGRATPGGVWKEMKRNGLLEGRLEVDEMTGVRKAIPKWELLGYTPGISVRVANTGVR